MEIPKKENMVYADNYAELKEDKDQVAVLAKDILRQNGSLAAEVLGDDKLDASFTQEKLEKLGEIRMEVKETLEDLKFAVADNYRKEKAA